MHKPCHEYGQTSIWFSQVSLGVKWNVFITIYIRTTQTWSRLNVLNVKQNEKLSLGYLIAPTFLFSCDRMMICENLHTCKMTVVVRCRIDIEKFMNTKTAHTHAHGTRSRNEKRIKKKTPIKLAAKMRSQFWKEPKIYVTHTFVYCTRLYVFEKSFARKPTWKLWNCIGIRMSDHEMNDFK